MTNGIDALKATYIGRESTAGNPASTVTVHWRGEGELSDLRVTEFPNEHIGIYGGANRSYVPFRGAECTLSGDATFEQLPYILDAGLRRATSTQDGTSSGRIRSYAWPVTRAQQPAVSDLATMVVETGDNLRMERSRFVFVKQFSLSGSARESWRVSATCEGRELASVITQSTGVLLPNVEEMIFGNTLLYIDPATGTAGATLRSDTLLSATLEITTGWTPKVTASGRVDFSDIKFVGGEGTLELSFEHDAASDAEKAAWRNQEARVIRLLINGSTYTTAGTSTHTRKVCIIDCYGKWQSFEPLGEQDGNSISTGVFRIATAANVMRRLDILVTNELAALP